MLCTEDEKSAAEATPLLKPPPLPAIPTVQPSGVRTLLTRLLPLSTTYRKPATSTAMLRGALNVAPTPTPSELPDAGAPARVLTEPVAIVTTRSLLLFVSAWGAAGVGVGDVCKWKKKGRGRGVNCAEGPLSLRTT